MMERLKFDSEGKLIDLTNSEKPKINPIIDNSYWSLYEGENKLEPLKFSNGKTQEDVVKEVVDLIKEGNKIIFIHGVCGTGKSAIALNIARQLGKSSIVVPIKSLQKQYEQDYTSQKHVIKPNGQKQKISVITGRDNHDSVIEPGKTCADPFLPDTIKITERNEEQIKEFYEENPLIENKMNIDVKKLKRISIAPANPYWSPIIPSEFEVQLKDAKKKKYKGLNDKEFIFYHRRKGCTYYDQFQSYLDSDVIIFNSAKYKIEVTLDRKPETEVDIIDEADEFLDNLANQKELNLSRLTNALRTLMPEKSVTQEQIDSIMDLIILEEKNKRALGIEENEIFKIEDTKIKKILSILTSNPEIEAEIAIDELNYGNTALEIAKIFSEFFDETYLTYRWREKQSDHEDKDLVINLVTTNLSKKLGEIIEKNKALVLMSGTLHSSETLKKVFGLKEFKIVDAETKQPGIIEIHRTGKEFDCKYSNFHSGEYTKEDYLKSLAICLENAKLPCLIQVNAFEDLPSDEEVNNLNIEKVMSKERLRQLQFQDKTGKVISLFKSGLADTLFTTKCSRGIDFPGETCNSVIFTKYPNPNINDIFWRVLKKTKADYFWTFYFDKARREFLQRIYRAVRFPEDHVYVLSPDIRVLKEVQNIQRTIHS